MSRTGIVYNDVANAAVQLQGLNENPTVDRVREVLGTGSKSTIARHLKDWKANNGALAVKNNLPTEIIAIVSGLWENLQTTADQAIKQHQAQADLQIEEVQTNLTKAENSCMTQQEQIQQLETALHQEQNTSKTLNEILTTARLEYSKNQERAHNLELQLADQKQENARLHSLLINVQNNLEHYQAAMQQQQQEQYLQAEKQKLQFEQEIGEVRQQLLATINISHDQKIHIEQLNQIINNTQSQIIDLQEKHQLSVKQNESSKKTLEDKNKLLVEAEQKVAVAMSRYSDLQQVLEKANDKITLLQHEQLLSQLKIIADA